MIEKTIEDLAKKYKKTKEKNKSMAIARDAIDTINSLIDARENHNILEKTKNVVFVYPVEFEELTKSGRIHPKIGATEAIYREIYTIKRVDAPIVARKIQKLLARVI
jgi:hypothetical protein